MSNYKYQIENSISMEAKFMRLMQQQDFEHPTIKEAIAEEGCHLYMICSRPSITFAPDKILISKDYIEGDFLINRGNYIDTHRFKTPNPAKISITDYEITYPNKEIDLLNKEGKVVSGGRASFLYPHLMHGYNECLDLKVLYVGQAYGKDGERIAAERLASHSTLQQIYSDVFTTSPNKEIWIILLRFEPYLISATGSGFQNALGDMEASSANLIRSLSTPVTPDQQITLTEAALIRYFEPYYNNIYKTNFPSESHSSYNQCYKLDLNSVTFILETSILITRLYSENVSPSFSHIKNYPLYAQEDRKNMFEDLNNLED